MKKTRDIGSFRINIGAPSIILILVVSALTVFALLSIRASYNELTLAEASRDSAVNYYRSDSYGVEMRAEIEDIVSELASQPEKLMQALADKDGVTSVDMEQGYVEYEVRVNDNSRLRIGLAFDEPQKGCRVVLHKIVVDPMEGYSGSAFEILDPIWID